MCSCRKRQGPMVEMHIKKKYIMFFLGEENTTTRERSNLIFNFFKTILSGNILKKLARLHLVHGHSSQSTLVYT